MLNYIKNLLSNNTLIITQPQSIQVNGFNIIKETLESNNHSQKYAEKLTFGNGSNSTNYAIAIGYNPAQNAPQSIDKTNQLICYHLQQNGYAGYYLLNLFSDVSPRKTKNTAFFQNFAQIFNYCTFDIYIFWGSSVYVNNTLCDIFTQALHNHSIYTIGNQSAQHHHPGRNTSTQTINSVLRSNFTLTNHFLK